MKKFVKPAFEDPDNSVDLFDSDRKNIFGGMYCVAPAILPRDINLVWNNYIARQQISVKSITKYDGKIAKPIYRPLSPAVPTGKRDGHGSA
jgi:hypothetical protein